jgi:hypothetical protein
VDLRDAIDFARTNHCSVPTTIRGSGLPQLSPVATRPDDGTADELVTCYQAVSGEHEDTDAYRAAMVTDRRPEVRLVPGRAYGMFSLPPRSGARQEQP